jgi:hypothetical protein
MASLADRRWLLLALSLPLLSTPRWIVTALRAKSPESFAFAYIQFLQELFNNVGFVSGYLSSRLRSQAPITPTRPVPAPN